MLVQPNLRTYSSVATVVATPIGRERHRNACGDGPFVTPARVPPSTSGRRRWPGRRYRPP
ncbi:hypothetical protein [Mycobacteroides abscessus]|uniref:hypothetical protein n=1 Tax=Mycobacteroides abscessus TaxID=36809 RepID=UPI003B42D28C